MANGPGVGHGLGTATLVFGAVHAVLGPELEGNSNDVIALFKQKRGGSGGIDSTAHATNYSLTLLNGHKGILYEIWVECKMVWWVDGIGRIGPIRQMGSMQPTLGRLFRRGFKGHGIQNFLQGRVFGVRGIGRD